MAADALAPCVARPSVAMVLINPDENVTVIHGEGYLITYNFIGKK